VVISSLTERKALLGSGTAEAGGAGGAVGEGGSALAKAAQITRRERKQRTTMVDNMNLKR